MTTSNNNSKPVVTRSIISFSNPKKRDKTQPQVPVMSKSGIKMLHPYSNPVEYHSDSLKVTFQVADESITPPETLSQDILKSLIASDTKVALTWNKPIASVIPPLRISVTRLATYAL